MQTNSELWGAGVSEEKEGPESGPDGIGAGADSGAMALAFGRASPQIDAEAVA